MSVLAATAAAMLLVASPGSISGTDAGRLAATGGFLLGNAHRCGIPTDRVVRTGQLIRELIAAAARDTDEQETATERFAKVFMATAARDTDEQETATERFAKVFMATAAPDAADGKLAASCDIVSSEFEKLEGHQVAAKAAKPETAPKSAAGNTARPKFRLGDGE